MKKFSLIYAFLLMGFTAIVAQVVLIRELLTSFSGNELAIGIFFANWLLLEALGSYGAGRWAGKVTSGTSYYVCLQLLLALALPTIIFLTRIAKNLLGIIPGQGINVFTIFYASLFLLIPLALTDGAQFSFGCRLFTEGKNRGVLSIGKVYIYEAIGSLVGGVVATYLCLQYFNSFQTALALALLNIFSALLLLLFVGTPDRGNNQRRWYQLTVSPPRLALKIAAGLLLLICGLLVPLAGIDYLHTRSVAAQWRNYAVLDYRNSIYGNVTVIKRFEQLNIMSNGVPVSTIPNPDIAFIEEFVHLALLAHPHPRKVLLVGGGIGGVLQEILKHPLQKIHYAELDPLIIHSAQRHAPGFSAADMSDPRVKVHYVDGRYFIRTDDEQYDVIFINLPDPSTLEINRYYTLEFYQMSRQRLKQDGILCLRLPGSTAFLSRELIEVNANIIQTVKHVFPYLKIIPGEYNLLLASLNTSITTIQPDVLTQRMRQRALQTRLLSDFHIRYKFEKTRLEWYDKEMAKAAEMPYNRDFHPSALYYDLVFWNSVHSPGFAAIFTQLKHLRLGYIVIAVFVMFVILFFLQRSGLAWKKSFIVLPIIATGFAGMAVDIVLVLAFQSFYGYLYHWIGLLIAAFMVGLTSGGMWMTHRLKGKLKSEGANAVDDTATFLKLELFIVLYTGLFIGVLALLNRFQEYAIIFAAAQYILLVLNALCGFLVGAEFPLANKIYLKNTSQYTQTAGSLYATDLIGSWLGALFVTIAFIPLLGILPTCLLILIINAGSLLFFYFTPQ
jgi:spermidine synthase